MRERKRAVVRRWREWDGIVARVREARGLLLGLVGVMGRLWRCLMLMVMREDCFAWKDARLDYAQILLLSHFAGVLDLAPMLDRQSQPKRKQALGAYFNISQCVLKREL